MFRPFQLVVLMSRWERWVLGVLVFGVVGGAVGIGRQFYLANTVLMPSIGGTYIEGSVGDLQPLNPWFIVQNDVNRDMVSLIFAGLLRYNPQTKKIEEDLATMETAADHKTYTLRLKDGLVWHDSTEKEPHPVTADDVIFTYKTIQDPAFPNLLLQQNFRGVTIQKIDDRTVRFSLEESYSFFPSNLTIGLLPARSFEGISVAVFDRHAEFGFNPVGAGPYRVKSVVQTDLSSEVTLERFPRPLSPLYRLDRIVFRVFPDYSTLLSDLRNLQGVRLVPRNTEGTPLIPKRFQARNYYLPQYVALFFNLDRKALQDEKLRQGLQQGTNKQAIAERIGESIIVDTPLLEIDTADWRYHFDQEAAQGALLASRWNIPERVRLQRLLEQEETNKAGALRFPTPILTHSDMPITYSGAYGAFPRGGKINGVPLRDGPSGTGSWVISLPILRGTGALRIGENLLRLTDPEGKTLDSFYLSLADTPQALTKIQQERELMRRYVVTRDGKATAQERLLVTDLFLDAGTMRLRQPSDPPSVRQNERGEPLVLKLLTSSAPAAYKSIAEEIKKEWALLGVRVEIDVPETRDEFQERLLRRDYDLVLFGQSLLDNLDSYPYWHSSGVQQLTGKEQDLRRDAYNLSQYRSFEADALLESIRRTATDEQRQQALTSLRDVLEKDVPAIFLYSPLYTFSHRSTILGIELGSLSLHSDRFLTLYKWYSRRDRVFKAGTGWASLPGWLWGQVTGAEKEVPAQ
jgi:ABC-type transport system substrate-binding protein